MNTGLNERVMAAARKIDETIDAQVAASDTAEEIQYLEQYRNELHQLLAQRAMAEALNGHAR